MKKFIAAMALATLVASPVLAQSWDPDVGSGNIVPAPYGQTQDGYSTYQRPTNGYNAHAQAPRHHAKATRSVVEDNQVVGADPDVNVRAELRRDNVETEF